MDFETAKLALAYIYDFIKDRAENVFTIGFTGGEPLLNFSVIRKIVNYSKLLFKNWTLRFSITTNGTQFTGEIIDFFIKNNFSLYVSLDGPKENHDAKRILNNRDGTFSLLLKNILEIEKQNMKYFRENIRFLPVYSKDLSLRKLLEFFKNGIFKKHFIKLSFVNELNTEYYKKNPYNYNKFSDEVEQILKEIAINIKKDRKLTRIELELKKKFLDAGRLYENRFSTNANTCLFNSRLTIDPRGNFHICDKINDKFPIGNIQDGFDFIRMRDILQEFLSIDEKHCSQCYARFLCGRCYIRFAKNGYFEFDEDVCNERKKAIFDHLKRYVKFNTDINSGKRKTKSYEFHQFVTLEKGPINTAIIDFLSGNVFQVENKIIEKFRAAEYNEIMDFMESAKNEKLIMEVPPNIWMPSYLNEHEILFSEKENIEQLSIVVEMDEGLDLNLVKDKLKGFYIIKIVYYGERKIDDFFPSVVVEYKKKDISACIKKSTVMGKIAPITNENVYFFNKVYNSCWGKKIAVTKDGIIRPCIYSKIEIGDIKKEDIKKMIPSKVKSYWYLTKNVVERCKDCELRYVCFDCREIAAQKGGSIYAPNPHCKYNPKTGIWASKKIEKEEG